MNRDIKLMIELQRFWGVILESRSDIDRHRKSLEHWHNEYSDQKNKVDTLNSEIYAIKAQIKNSESELDKIENHINELEDKRRNLSSVRELEALDSEIKKNKDSQGNIEELLIEKMDSLEALENSFTHETDALKEQEKQLATDTELLNDKIQKSQEKISDYKKRFDEVSQNLSSQFRSKFVKILESKGCRAIAPVENNVCGNCHFQIPEHLVREAANDEKVVLCLNCGGFIYVE